MVIPESLTQEEIAQLAECESIIKNGMPTFLELGQALFKIRNEKLYRETHTTFETYCEEKWGIGIRHSQRLINAAKVVDNLRQCDQLVVLPTSESQARPLTELTPEEQRDVWKSLTAEHKKVTGKIIEATVQKLKNQRSFNKDLHFSSSSDEWYTPTKIISPSLKLLGEIDLDPCSNSKTTPNIPAKNHFTINDDGLAHSWQGKIFLNPPFCNGIKDWIEKLLHHYNKEEIHEAVALLPARTETKWFALLREFPRCFILGRLYFSDKPQAAPFPSVVVYLGSNKKRFKECFESLGDIYTLMVNDI